MNCKIESAVSMQVVASVVALASLSMPAFAADNSPASAQQKTLKGRVESRTGNRLSRPAMPASPLGDVFDNIGKPGEPGVKLNAQAAKKDPLDALKKDDFNFRLQLLQSSKNDPEETKAAEADQKDRDLMIAWDAWHKRVCEAIQRNWVAEPHIPHGDERVAVNITKDGRVHFHMINYHHQTTSSELFDTQREHEIEFEAAVANTLRGIERKKVLTFPNGSLRKQVEFTARFQTDADQEGYTWKQGDYERVPTR